MFGYQFLRKQTKRKWVVFKTAFAVQLPRQDTLEVVVRSAIQGSLRMSQKPTMSNMLSLLKHWNRSKQLLQKRAKEQALLQQEVYRKILSSFIHGVSQNSNIEMEHESSRRLDSAAHIYAFPTTSK